MEQLSPQGVQALGESIATKLEWQIQISEKTTANVYQLERQQAEMVAALKLVQHERMFLHYSAVIGALTALLITALVLFSLERYTEKLSTEIRDLKADQAKSLHDSGSPSH